MIFKSKKEVVLDNVTVVVRYSSESTLDRCTELILKEINKENLFVIQEKPFSNAVRKTFEVGITQAKDWTLAIDADLLIFPDSIRIMIENAEKQCDKPYVYQGYILDWFKGGIKYGGPHLYRTEFLSEALSLLISTESSLRPESSLYKLMSERGKNIVVDKKLFALHDFYQSSKDIYRKAYFHGIKHKGYTDFVPNWLEKSKSREEYKFCVLGFLDGYFLAGREYPELEFLENAYFNKFGDYIFENELMSEINFKEVLKEYKVRIKPDLKVK